ncbi:DUF6333 family protein [Streptomyces sp. T-3]|nr:DUF6333 family protein [Streptomyces sp. T-3]
MTGANTQDGADAQDASGAEDIRPKMGSQAELSLLFPPFPDSAAERGAPAPHDPVRARRVVEELGTVAEVLEELPQRLWSDVPFPDVRAGLDVVAVGCWGNVVYMVDPALGSDLLTTAMTEEVRRQRARHPEARIAGRVDMDYGNSYLETVIDLPGGVGAFAGGWDCDDDWEYLAGDPAAVLHALGVDRESAVEAGFDLDEKPWEREWPVLGNLAIWGLHSGPGKEQVSLFRVRRTDDAAFDLKEVWFGRW